MSSPKEGMIWNRLPLSVRYRKRSFSPHSGQPSPCGTMAERASWMSHGQTRKKSGQQNQPHTDRRKNFWKTQRLSHARVAQDGSCQSRKDWRDSSQLVMEGMMNSAMLLFTELTNASIQLELHLSFHDFIPIFRYPDQMILAMPQNMCYLTKPAHAISFLTVGTVEII